MRITEFINQNVRENEVKPNHQLLKIFIFGMLVLIPILAVDYYVDAYASFRVTYDKIGMMGSKSNYCVGEEIPLSERKAKWGKINNASKIDYMVMGSSRSMQFSKENLGLEYFLNLGVPGGSSVRDYMAETYILYHNNELPQYLLIEISPSIFNENSGEYRWMEWGQSADYMQKILEGESVSDDDSKLLGIRMEDILSLSYFKYNISQLKEHKRTKVFENDEIDNEDLGTQHVDGSYAYSRKFQVKNDDSMILQEINSICNSNAIYCCSNFEKLDDERINQFCKLVDFWKSQGIEVSFYLPPYAEPMYEYILETEIYAPILEVEKWALEYAVNNDIQVYGSYNPEGSKLKLNDLYDAYHIRDNKVKDTLWPRYESLPDYWNK